MQKGFIPVCFQSPIMSSHRPEKNITRSVPVIN